jgi:uncharacterized protein YecE (DUF72 family)
VRIAVGTSGFSYKEWKGTFYPAKFPESEMLQYYSERFGTVEINNTFYRMPKKEMLEKWPAQVPPSFTFILKASQRITHIKRLKDVQEEVAYFFEQAAVLGSQLGPVLFQLPPHSKKDLPRLQTFLGTLPANRPAAMEFRNETWLSDDVYDALREHNVALCIADTDEETTPFVATADWGYLRLRGTDYPGEEMQKWAERVAGQDWGDAFVFFKHEDEGRGPALGQEFLQLLADKPDVTVT